MENATKALLIAGAVLLVIMIISVGLMIFNSANGQISNAISSMNQQEKDQFNNKFYSYEGRQSGSSIKTLYSTVISHNKQMADESTSEKQVGIKLNNASLVGELPIERVVSIASRDYVEGVFSVAAAKKTNTTNTTKGTTTTTDYKKDPTELETERKDIASGATYKVTVNLNSTTGLVDRIDIDRI